MALKYLYTYHPLVATRGRRTRVQNVELFFMLKPDSHTSANLKNIIVYILVYMYIVKWNGCNHEMNNEIKLYGVRIVLLSIILSNGIKINVSFKDIIW